MKKVIRCEIDRTEEPQKVEVQFEDMEIKELFRFYSDEVNFTPEELVGLTESECRNLFGKKDREYLMS